MLTWRNFYEVKTRRLNEQVRRNSERFPEDFMFQLTAEEFANLKSQFATSKGEVGLTGPVSRVMWQEAKVSRTRSGRDAQPNPMQAMS